MKIPAGPLRFSPGSRGLQINKSMIEFIYLSGLEVLFGNGSGVIPAEAGAGLL